MRTCVGILLSSTRGKVLPFLSEKPIKVRLLLGNPKKETFSFLILPNVSVFYAWNIHEITIQTQTVFAPVSMVYL